MRKGLSEKKNLIRKTFLALRLTLSDDDVLKKSVQISEKVLGLDAVNTAKKILTYIPVNKEVETKEMIDNLLHIGKEIFVPSFWNNNYVASRFTSWSSLEVGPFEILQPKLADFVDSNKVNVALIPGIVFSQTGFRLGYGKGVYDKLLFTSNAYKIGLAYDFQIVNDLPVEEHDLRMDMIVSEKRLINII